MTVPDREIRVFADFDRADTLLNAKLDRGIQRDELERLLFSQVAPVHRFRGLDIHAARTFVRIGVHRDDDSRARHDRRVVGNRVVSFDLVTPRVGKYGSAGAVRGDLFRNLVTFEDVLERLDFETKLVREARSEEHTSELQSQSNLVCRLLLEKKNLKNIFRPLRGGVL